MDIAISHAGILKGYPYNLRRNTARNMSMVSGYPVHVNTSMTPKPTLCISGGHRLIRLHSLLSPDRVEKIAGVRSPFDGILVYGYGNTRLYCVVGSQLMTPYFHVREEIHFHTACQQLLWSLSNDA